MKPAEALDVTVNAIGKRWLEHARQDARTIATLRGKLAAAERKLAERDAQVEQLGASLASAKALLEGWATRFDAELAEFETSDEGATPEPASQDPKPLPISPRGVPVPTAADLAPRGTVAHNYAGERFGTFVAVGPTAERSFGYVVWLLRCEGCGDEVRWSSQKLSTFRRLGSKPNHRCPAEPPAGPSEPSSAPEAPPAAPSSVAGALPHPDEMRDLPGARPLPEGLSREARRSRRLRLVRPRTESVRRLPKHELRLGTALYPEAIEGRPQTRGECQGGCRPCPFVGCKWNLYLDVNQRTGAIKLNFPDLEPEQMTVSCALDVADAGGATLEQVGAYINCTRERIRQVETAAYDRMQKRGGTALGDLAESFEPRGESPLASAMGEDW